MNRLLQYSWKICQGLGDEDIGESLLGGGEERTGQSRKNEMNLSERTKRLNPIHLIAFRLMLTGIRVPVYAKHWHMT